MSNRYLKAVLTAAVPLVAAVGMAIQTGVVNTPEIALGITGFVAAGLVAVFPNKGTGFQNVTKFVLAAVTPVVSALLQYLFTEGPSTSEWSTLVVGLLTSLLVYFASNDVGSVNDGRGDTPMAGPDRNA